MKSTSISKPQTILRVSELNLLYKIPLRKNHSWRDVFTEIVRDPLNVVAPEKERLHVARDITFEVKEGERLGLLGINGTGKTSLCRCIAGMFIPTSGHIERFAPIRAIFDVQLGIQPELTGRENGELLTQFLYPEEQDPKAILNEALEFSELERFADVPFKLYSNGMQTRLCLSLVSARPAGILVLDEVFDGADQFFRQKISERFKNIIETSGAVIFVSHSADQIMKVCNRVLVLNQGRIHFDGPPEQAIAAYEKLYQMN